MKKILLFILGLFLISSCDKQELILSEVKSQDNTIENSIIENNIMPIENTIINEKIYTVIPHHNLVNKDIDKFYKNLKEKYSNFDNIVIISPDHFQNDYYTPKKAGKYCDKMSSENCVDIKILEGLETTDNIISFSQKDGYIETYEHGISNHFQFINKYFDNPSIYAILLKINTKEDDELKKIENYLNNYDFKGKTLFITSVDFSHHVNEKVAVFHDLNTIDYLNNGNVKNLEVDCPNCLYLTKKLSALDDKNFFNVYNRTSTDKYLGINANYNNTSHIYGEFENTKDDNMEKVFSGSYLYSTFEQTNSGTINQNQIFGMFFGDAHFTRGFTYSNNTNTIQDYLSCFYSNKDLSRDPKFWHNRFFYGFDFVGVNLETSVGEKNECQYSQKEIKFQTEPKYMDYFKEIGINIYNLANNHSYDCGDIGFQATKKHLDDKGLYYFGDGRKSEENIFKKEINGTKIAFVGFNDIGNQINIDSKSQKIEKLNDQGYIVIVNIHWGFEYATESNKRQQKIAHKFIDSGAKLIIGHHPHVVQNYETYKGVPIFYSLGNFIFDQPFENTLKEYGIVYDINGNGIKYNILELKRNPENYKIDCDSFK